MEVKPGLRRRRGIARWTRSMAFNTSGRWDLQFRLAGIYLTRNWCWGRVKLDLVNCAWLISRPCKGSLLENILFACSEAWKNWIHQSDQGRCWSKHCQRHNGPEGWVLVTKVNSLGRITSSQTNLDQISSSYSRRSSNFKTSTQYEHFD